MSKKTKNQTNTPDVSLEKKPKKANVFLNTFIFLLVIAFGAVAFVRMDLLDLIKERYESETMEYALMGDVQAFFNHAVSAAETEIKNRKPIYTIDLDSYTAPPPDPSKYDEAFENYSDKTIEVHYYNEIMYDSWFHFAEIRISHPSQFRLALANDTYGEIRKLPSQIASEVNAVVAVNGCFYNRRPRGFLLYRRKILRNKPFGIDVLLIDSEGNFHIVEDKNVKSCGVLDEFDIISGVGFGPELVRDGKALRITKLNWEPITNEPRTAICQYEDDLHYLICVAEGRNRRSVGVTMKAFAEEIAKKGVKTAYNLDGGQSGTLVLGNRLKNKVGWGPEKPQGDILYFATALEENERD